MDRASQPTPAELKLLIKDAATTADLQGFGICEANPSPNYGAYVSWIENGYQADMSYLERHILPKSDPRHLLPGVKSVLAFSMNYNQSPPGGQAKIARYAIGRDYHKVLFKKLKSIAKLLGEASHRVCVDSTPLLERDYAHLAGLGWFGKNTCLIDSKRGSWFVLGFILTDLVLPYDKPAMGGCGTCTKCIDSCPTGAIVSQDGRWQVDSRRCISYLTIEHKGEFTPRQAEHVGEWTFGCDVCQEVCPFNQPREGQPLRSIFTTEPDLLRGNDLPRELTSILNMDEEAWDLVTQGSPIRRAGFEGIKRNARANLINLMQTD